MADWTDEELGITFSDEGFVLERRTQKRLEVKWEEFDYALPRDKEPRDHILWVRLKKVGGARKPSDPEKYYWADKSMRDCVFARINEEHKRRFLEPRGEA